MPYMQFHSNPLLGKNRNLNIHTQLEFHLRWRVRAAAAAVHKPFIHHTAGFTANCHQSVDANTKQQANPSVSLICIHIYLYSFACSGVELVKSWMRFRYQDRHHFSIALSGRRSLCTRSLFTTIVLIIITSLGLRACICHERERCVQRAANPLRVNASRKNSGIKEKERGGRADIYIFLCRGEKSIYGYIFYRLPRPITPFYYFMLDWFHSKNNTRGLGEIDIRGSTGCARRVPWTLSCVRSPRSFEYEICFQIPACFARSGAEWFRRPQTHFSILFLFFFVVENSHLI